MEYENNHRFFNNRDCGYFPCHQAPAPERFNCLFCYCPLYVLGKRCGGNFRYNEKGIKVCTDCAFPHVPENYDKIVARFPEIAEAVRCMDAAQGGDPQTGVPS